MKRIKDKLLYCLAIIDEVYIIVIGSHIVIRDYYNNTINSLTIFICIIFIFIILILTLKNKRL